MYMYIYIKGERGKMKQSRTGKEVRNSINWGNWGQNGSMGQNEPSKNY